MTHHATCSCPVCGGSDFIRAGETVSEVLDYVPASFRVVSCAISSPASPARAAIRKSG
ncbi:IS66 family transposase zinc-finger binding domain-containing protein [Neorhizobium galegae]|uniref:IS66 family transposase zinc-finger binding domain-containing protein n=1 Tax=Neorhizobium galegae TaxID=399 RepID=UPI00351E2FB8